MQYFELDLKIEPEYSEILVAELAEIGFDSFLDSPDGIVAYVTEDLFDDRAIKNLLENYASRTPLSYSIKAIEKQNWNKEWESAFSPIEVSDKIYVRATFHEPAPATFPYEIIITPKMSFGTGHHETTSQVLELQMDIDHKGKSVLDVGTGTGILAILASKLGAEKIHAFDIDEWSVENTIENISLNNTPEITVNQGTIADQKIEQYDILIANINRNILLDEIPQYVKFMKNGASLLLSGFYEHDVPEIESKCNEQGLKKLKQISKNNWAAVVFIRE
ncbi:MAG: 50S ribosomal protein L11 methyltransferase [Bacteroidetes bacterium]|nr:50S ribosomal protein L11 methyltransferase [Bacteroidota bacterium]